MSKLLDNAVDEFSRLPGVGRRTALRLAMHVLKMDKSEVHQMTDAIASFRDNVCRCTQCNNISDDPVCEICSNESRDESVVCVVEQVADLMSIEKTNQFKGVYCVLGGVISPLQGIAPSDLRIDLLLSRIEKGKVREVIIAISTSVEGETTLFYLMNILKRYPEVKVTNIARGIGFGDELEYVDEHTITQALINRREIEPVKL